MACCEYRAVLSALSRCATRAGERDAWPIAYVTPSAATAPIRHHPLAYVPPFPLAGGKGPGDRGPLSRPERGFELVPEVAVGGADALAGADRRVQLQIRIGRRVVHLPGGRDRAVWSAARGEA